MSADPPLALNFPFADAEHQRESALFGMWVFLATEVLFFGGAFAAYMVYRFSHTQAFLEAGAHQEWFLGCLNTFILLTSGFTMALAVTAAQLRNRKVLLWCLLLTGLLGATFLAVEFYEYFHLYQHHLVPGRSFQFTGSDPGASELFFCLYFTMTGLHLFHVSVGLLLLLYFGLRLFFYPLAILYSNPIEVLGLYWAFVDIVWLYLYPLFYLVHP